MKIAITGKGGSGKTMLTALMVKILSSKGDARLLAIDADSAVNLPYALGMEPRRTVAQIRRQIIEDPEARAQIEDKSIRAVMKEALEAGEGFSLLVMGRPEGPGCYCSINDLLRYGIDGVAEQFGITLIDCEAGPEQVNRRVVKGVDMLIIVTDPSIRGARVTDSIVEVIRSDKSISPARSGIVVNRYRESDAAIRDRARSLGLELLGSVPEDENVSRFDAEGRPLIELPDGSPSVAAVSEILKRVIS